MSCRPSLRYSAAASCSVASIILTEKVNPNNLASITCLPTLPKLGLTGSPVIFSITASCLSSSKAMPSSIDRFMGSVCILARRRYTSASVASMRCRLSSLDRVVSSMSRGEYSFS